MVIGRKPLVIQLVIAFGAGLLLGFMLNTIALQLGSQTPSTPHASNELPEDLQEQLNRFTFFNRSTNGTLREYKVIGKAVGAYDRAGDIFETYVLGFEDRLKGAEADMDFLDLMVELKRVRGSKMVTVRIVQLGLDTIDIYLDSRFLGSVRPTIEVQVGK